MAVEKKTVCVTGASGFLAAHVVQQLLKKGYTVHGTVRDATNEAKTAHLRQLEGAKERLTLFSADLTGTSEPFVEAFEGCDGVIHTATPVSLSAGDELEKSIYEPAMAGLERVLEAAEAKNIKHFVLTSSMAAIKPTIPGPVRSEGDWTDPEEQRRQKRWYRAAKTDQETRATEWASKNNVRFAAINPTFIMGPMLQPYVNETMEFLADVVSGAKFAEQCPNDSMSFVDVRDCAAHHVAAYENPAIQGRFMSLVEAMHWNDITKMLKKIIKEPPLEKTMRDVPPFVPGDDTSLATPTVYDHTRMNTLGVEMRDLPTIFRDALIALQERGALKTLD